MTPSINVAAIGTFWSLAWPYITAAISIASTLNALPQPKAGSHWIPVRKIISFISLSVGGAKNVDEPPLGTWLLRLVGPVLTNQGLKLVAVDLADVVDQATAKPVPPAVPTPSPVTPS